MNFLCSYLYIVATCNGRLFAAACSNLARSPLSLPLSFSRFCGLYTTLFRICITHTLHLTKPILQVMSLKMRSLLSIQTFTCPLPERRGQNAAVALGTQRPPLLLNLAVLSTTTTRRHHHMALARQPTLLRSGRAWT